MWDLSQLRKTPSRGWKLWACKALLSWGWTIAGAVFLACQGLGLQSELFTGSRFHSCIWGGWARRWSPCCSHQEGWPIACFLSSPLSKTGPCPGSHCVLAASPPDESMAAGMLAGPEGWPCCLCGGLCLMLEDCLGLRHPPPLPSFLPSFPFSAWEAVAASERLDGWCCWDKLPGYKRLQNVLVALGRWILALTPLLQSGAILSCPGCTSLLNDLQPKTWPFRLTIFILRLMKSCAPE